MRTITINFIPDGEYETIEAEAVGFAEEDIIQAIEHALLQLKIHGGNRVELKRVK